MMNRVIVFLLSCVLVAEVSKAQLDTLAVVTPKGTGHITMDEQPCAVTWRGRTYRDVMVRGRGHVFASFPDKQPMRLRFAAKTALLGRGNAKARKWTVLAMNDDPTLMRDAVAWFIARRMGMDYVPAHEYAEVTVDGRRQGVCLVADHVEAGHGRVPVSKSGWLAELDGYADGRFFYTARHRLAVRLHSPDGYGDAFYAAAADVMEMEEALCRSDAAFAEGRNETAWFLTAELIANPDTYWSLYFYRTDSVGPIHFGPVWDSGKAFGNDSRFTDTWHRRVHDFAFNAAWGRALTSSPQFNAAVRRHWRSIDRRQLLQDILSYIDHLESILHTDGTPLRHFITRRIAYLDEVL